MLINASAVNVAAVNGASEVTGLAAIVAAGDSVTAIAAVAVGAVLSQTQDLQTHTADGVALIFASSDFTQDAQTHSALATALIGADLTQAQDDQAMYVVFRYSLIRHIVGSTPLLKHAQTSTLVRHSQPGSSITVH